MVDPWTARSRGGRGGGSRALTAHSQKWENLSRFSEYADFQPPADPWTIQVN